MKNLAPLPYFFNEVLKRLSVPWDSGQTQAFFQSEELGASVQTMTGTRE